VLVPRLYAVPERGDRLIAATASRLECPFITKYPAMASLPGFEVMGSGLPE
jgi:hypothetical protein